MFPRKRLNTEPRKPPPSPLRIMASFYYFLPGVTKSDLLDGGRLKREPLAAAGIDEVLFDVDEVPQHVSLAETHRCSGPWKSTGTMLAIVNKHTGVPQLVVPDFDRQLWLPRGNPQKCWIGALKGEPPLPEELERWEQIPGYTLSDPGKYSWRVPVARMPGPEWQFGHLPQSYVFSDSGRPEGRLQPAYQWLWDLAGTIRDWYREDEPLAAGAKKQPFEWLVQQAARILGVNYRVGYPELTLLHNLGRPVLTQTTAHAVCQALFGFEVLEEAKKKLPDTASSPALNSSSLTTGDETPPASPGTDRAGEA